MVVLVVVCLGFEGLVMVVVFMYFVGFIFGCVVFVWLVGIVVGWFLWCKCFLFWVSVREGVGYVVGGFVVISYFEVDKVFML